jgi:anti-sigma factor RsiW
VTVPGSECRKLLERVSAYLDGDLGPMECRVIERHCSTCPSCAELIAGLRNAIGLCHQASGRPLPDGVRQRAKARIRKLLSDQS